MFCRDVMTSCHDVTKPDLPISACRCARKLILFLFPWFFRSLSSKMPLTFYFCDSVTSWRHVMTSLNLIHLSQLVEELESSFFFVYMVLWVTEFKKIDDFSFVWFRDVMTSCHDVTKTVQPISGYEFTGKMIVFRIPQFFWLLILEMLVFMYLWDDIMSWRHVMTSRQYLTSPYSTY